MSATHLAALIASSRRHRLPYGPLQTLIELLARAEAQSSTTVTVSCTELAAVMGCARSTACRRLRRLRIAGLVEAHPDPARRATTYDIRAALEARR